MEDINIEELMAETRRPLKRIHVKPIELKYEKPLKCNYFYIELYATYLVYKYDFIAKKPIVDEDADSGWEERRMHSESAHKREKIHAIDFFKFAKEDKYQITLFVSGSSLDPTLYFLDENEAIKTYRLLMDWIFGNMPKEEK